MSEFRGRELKIIIAVFLLSGSFLFFGSVKKVSATLINDYNKPSYDTLQSEEWNNLALDFLNKNGTSTMTGPLGIGTTNPDAPLEVVGTIKATTFSGFLAGGVDAANVLGGGIFGSNWSLLANYSFPASLGIGTSTMLARLAVQGGGGDILNLFDSSAAEKLTVLNSGYVGIGITNPGVALDVSGVIRNSSYAIIGGYVVGNGNNLFYKGNVGRGSVGFDTSTAGGAYPIYFKAGDGVTYTGGYIHFDIGSSEVMRITNGKVGIGTTTPGKLLEVNGQAKFNNFAYGTTPDSTDILALTTVEYVNGKTGGSGGGGSNLWAGTTTGAIWNANGTNNVGIGTTNPGTLLTIANNKWISAVNTAGTGYDNMFKINSSDQIEIGSPLLIGPLELAQDGGFLTFIDMPITSAATIGTVEGYSLRLDGNSLLNLYSTSDGAGGVNNLRVGIGTITPGYLLDVQGGQVNASNGFCISGDCKTAWSQVGGAFWNLNGSNLYASSTGWNVGIGTTTPGKLLDVNGQAIFRNFAYGTTPASTDILALSTVEYVNAKVGGSAGVGTGTSGQTLRHDGTGWIANSTLFNDGTNVGIGTTNPGTKLSVAGVDNKDTGPIIDLAGSSANQTESGRIRFTEVNLQVSPYYQGAFIHFNGLANTLNIGVHNNADSLTANDLNAISIARSTGAVSIGNTALNVLYNGNVGIGTTTPGKLLDVNGQAIFRNFAYGTTPASTDILALSTVEYVNAKVGGSAGVGTGTSGQTLRHNGTGWVANSTLFNDETNVGIGTTAPFQKLDITGGSMRLDNTTGVTPTGIMYKGTDPFISDFNYGNNGTVTTVGNNTFVGIGAGNLTMGSTAIQAYQSSYNTAVGNGALHANTTGYRNTANGHFSLYSNTTGTNNTANGYYSLYSNTIGSNNTANGHYSLYSNTTSNSNTANGYSSLNFNTTGSSNTANGYYSLYSNTTGSNNTANGLQSLYDLGSAQTAGAFNIGTSYTIKTVGTTDFTIIGASANTVGIVFTTNGVGAGTGTAIPNATNNNTALGYNTGRGIIYGTGNTILGANVTGLSAGLTNNIIIADGVGHQRINVDSNGNVGIGTTTPGKLLDVNGQAIFRNFAYGTTPASTDILALSTVEYVNAKVGGSAGVGTGTSGQTLRHNGTGWVANSTLFNDGTNVGIGTTDPGAKLQIATVDTSVQPAIRLRISSAPTYGIDMDMEQNLTGYFALYSVRAGVRTLGLTQGWGAGNLGNVGINITNPLSRLAIKGTGNASTTSALDVQGNDGISHLFVRDDGNVGIGTTNPEYKLDVNGFSRLGSGAAINSTSGNWIYYPNVVSYSSSNTIVGALVVHTNLNRSSVEIFKMRVIGYGYGSASNIDFTVVGYAYSGANGNVDGLGGAAVNYSIVDNGNDGLTKRIGIDAAGNVAVAVGDATSSFYYYRLAVDYWSTRNSVNASTGWSIDTNAVSGFGWGDLHVLSPAITQLTSGNVGIGTTTPGKLLEVNGQAKFNNFAYGTTPASTDILALSTVEYVNAKVGGSAGVGTGTSGQTLRHNGTGWVANSTLFNDGTNVGIGTAAPYTRLSINNNASEYNSANSKISVYADAASTYGIGFGKYTNYGVGIYAGDSFTAAPKVFVESTGNVGIGTTTPSEKLEVNGRVKIGDNTVSGENFTFVDTAPGMKVQNQYGNLNITPLNSGWLHFYTDRSNFIFNKPIYIIGGRLASYSTSDLTLSAGGTDNDLTIINTTGNVGIGTTTPGKLLEVNGQAKFNNFAYGTTPVSTDLLALSTVEYVNGKTGGSGGVGTGTSGQTLRHNGTGWVANSTLFNDGTNVGIGTAAPLAKLHIDSVADASGLMLSTGVDNSNSPYILFADRYGANIGAGIKAIASGGYGKKDLTFYTGKSDSWTSTVSDLTERMRITNSGNVGIGTTGPLSKLDIRGALVIPSGLTNADSRPAVGTSRISGEISGVGANGVLGANDGFLRLSAGGGSAASQKSFIDLSGYSQVADMNENIIFGTAGSEAMRINSLGNVGIGTTTPGKLLDVNGQAIFRNFAYGTTPVSTDILALATVEYVNGITGGVYLPIAGGTMTGSIAMGNNNISNVNTLTVTKINATTIDPLYSLNGVNYATFAASIAGGVKEECLGKIKINRLAGREYESVINFSDIAQGSDLWVWRQVVDFNFDNVEVSITPYGKFAQVYYLIEGNKLIFRSDRPVEISYRLTGRRFDWRQWPTKPLDQSEKGVKVE